jgi:hypothetical protein
MTPSWYRFRRKVIRWGLFWLLMGTPTTALPAEIMNEFALSLEMATELAGEAEGLWQGENDKRKLKQNQ